MNIVIDFGNTSVKIGLIDNQELVKVFYFDNSNFDFDKFKEIIKNSSPKFICYLNVTSIKKEIIDFFNHLSGVNIIKFDYNINFPFKINYKPLENLGIDRISGVVGANKMFPKDSFLLIQIGTCITYDLFDKQKGYMGGAISPGPDIRNKAMNTFTHKLPLIDVFSKEIKIIENTTHGSLNSGILNGIAFEIDGFINSIKKENNNIKIIISGGNMIYFVEMIKNKIFAKQNITLIGLKEIINIYEKN